MCCILQYKAKGGREEDFEMLNFQTVKPPTVRALSKNTMYEMMTFLKDAGEESITNQYSF